MKAKTVRIYLLALSSQFGSIMLVCYSASFVAVLHCEVYFGSCETGQGMLDNSS